MSIQSKAKRDAGKKRKSRERIVVGTASPSIEGHAELRDHEGSLLGGIARQDGEWVLGLDGQMVGGSDSAATILVMLKRAAAMHERAGSRVVLKFSATLRDAANEEVSAQGISLEQFEAQLDNQLGGTGPASKTAPSGSPAH